MSAVLTYRTDALQRALTADKRIPDKTFRWLRKSEHDHFWRTEHRRNVEPSIEYTLLQLQEYIDELCIDYSIDLSKVKELKA